MLLEDFYADEILSVQLFFCPAMSLFWWLWCSACTFVAWWGWILFLTCECRTMYPVLGEENHIKIFIKVNKFTQLSAT